MKIAKDHLPFIPPIRRRLEVPLLLERGHRVPFFAARAAGKHSFIR